MYANKLHIIALILFSLLHRPAFSQAYLGVGFGGMTSGNYSTTPKPRLSNCFSGGLEYKITNKLFAFGGEIVLQPIPHEGLITTVPVYLKFIGGNDSTYRINPTIGAFIRSNSSEGFFFAVEPELLTKNLVLFFRLALLIEYFTYHSYSHFNGYSEMHDQQKGLWLGFGVKFFKPFNSNKLKTPEGRNK